MTVSASLSSALKTAISGISGIGVVHDRPRYCATWSEYLNLFASVIGGHKIIRGWMISRDSAAAGTGEFRVTERVHNYVITGIAGFSDSDATSQYAAMQSLADTIMATLDAEIDLGVAGVEEGGIGPCSLESYQELMFGSVLAHVFTIAIPIRVFLPTGTA